MIFDEAQRRPSHDLSLHEDPLLARIFSARGITSAKQLQYRLADLPAPLGLSGLTQATTFLCEALRKQQKILIVGDYDADGATSTALMMSVLQAFGAKRVEYLVPDRFNYGYGLTPAIVEVAKTLQPEILITVDNGISSFEGVAAANAFGMQVVITDHHLPGEKLPAARAIVNPNQAGDAFVSKHLAGVGVAFYVLTAMRKMLREQGWFIEQGIEEPNMAQYLDLVALGTVADVVSLDHCNRILVQQGLLRIREGLARPGILALLDIAKREPKGLAASDLGFAVAPRLNAAGRLDDMSLGIACLLAVDKTEASCMAQKLDALNKERRAIESTMKLQALDIVQNLHFNERDLPHGLCLYNEQWHQGVIGIVAGRLKERFHRPVIVFADAGVDEIKGSARSIIGVHIRDCLATVAARFPDLISHFGGHAMAAGLSLAKDKLAAFKEAFVAVLGECLNEEILQVTVETDGELPASYFNLNFADKLRELGPWGQGFPVPCFEGRFHLLEQRLVGEAHLKMTLALPSSGQLINAIAFNVDLEAWPNHRCQSIQLVYQLEVNTYKGLRSIQLLVDHLLVAKD